MTRPRSSDFAIAKWGEGVFGFGGGPQANGGAGAVAKFQMSRDEVGVKVGEEDIFDLQFVLVGECDVLVGVALGINHDGLAGLLVANDVGRVGEAWEVELFEDHFSPLPVFGVVDVPFCRCRGDLVYRSEQCRGMRYGYYLVPAVFFFD